MANVSQQHLPCPCGSSDARTLYDDGSSFCFSCSTVTKAGSEEVSVLAPTTTSSYSKETVEEIHGYPGDRGFKDRRIKKEVVAYYKCKVSYGGNGEIDTHYYPYESGAAYKVRKLPKSFSWVGKSKALFGQELFPAGGRKLVICEGELDCLSVAQASYTRYQRFYPVVALSSSAMDASLLEAREWIRSFDEVVLFLDQDEAGLKCQAKAISIIGIDKVRLPVLSVKDPSDCLVQLGHEVLMQAVFNAGKYIPSGIITSKDIWKAIVEDKDKDAHPYAKCLGGVNKRLLGKREGEIVLFVSGTGSGKSTILKEEIINIIETSEDKVGIVSLEELPKKTARKLSSMKLGVNESVRKLSIDELQPGFDSLFGDDRIMIVDHQGSLDDLGLIAKLEYLALSKCKYIIIDHITILVSEGAGSLTGNEAIDKVMNDLLRIVTQFSVWIGLVSHLRKTPNGSRSFEEGVMPSMDDVKGSGSIKQICADIIGFARDSSAEDDTVRRTMSISVLKARETGDTGFVAPAIYDYPTGRYKSVDNFIPTPKEEPKKYDKNEPITSL